MRPTIYPKLVRFRADPALVAAAENKARRDGLTLSELLRHTLRAVVRDAA